ncbi:hypothetical protein HK099_001245 [Clydaea vesicula]|uniref:Zn(2)-C6 fungal-type domain-containing protein n=1 Tax=Clydaea vesicula TaxID=447962 RepID=A0AAD5U3Y0_9FUNG|nr:hypothetical protein HK099_001245 [Clydaea vesicula]
MKKTHIQCDSCRVIKRRCDGHKPSCGNCEYKGIVCIWGKIAKKRGPKVSSKAKLSPDLEIVSLSSESGDSDSLRFSPMSSPGHVISPTMNILNATIDISPRENLTEIYSRVPSSFYGKKSSSKGGSSVSSSPRLISEYPSDMEADKPNDFNKVLFNFVTNVNRSFDFSQVPYNILKDVTPHTHSFIQEFNTEESLLHFVNNDIMILPSTSTKTAVKKLELISVNFNKQIGLNDLCFYFMLFGCLQKGGQLVFLENPSPAIFEAPQQSSFSRADYQFHEEMGNNPYNFLKYFNILEPYRIYHELSKSCLVSRHPQLFTPEFGGSPQKAAIKFMDKAVIVAIASNWDKDEKFSKRDIMEKKDRRLKWVKFLSFTTFASYPFIGDEREHSEMLDQGEWDILWQQGDGVKLFNGAAKITVYTQIIWIIRKTIRFSKNELQKAGRALETATDIHRSLLGWIETLPPWFRPFQLLSEFIQGIRHIKVQWLTGAISLKFNIMFLYGMLKIHYKNNTLNPSFKFDFQLKSEGVRNGSNNALKATSMEFILCIIRALSSIMSLNLPSLVKAQIEKADYKRFSYNSEMIVYISVILQEFILIGLKSLELNVGWSSIEKIREEVLLFHLKKVFFETLKNFNTSFSKYCLEKVRLKLENAIGVLEIKKLYS